MVLATVISMMDAWQGKTRQENGQGNGDSDWLGGERKKQPEMDAQTGNGAIEIETIYK